MNFIGHLLFIAPIPWAWKRRVAERIGTRCKHGWMVGLKVLICSDDWQ
jgi:hypothetical protein